MELKEIRVDEIGYEGVSNKPEIFSSYEQIYLNEDNQQRDQSLENSTENVDWSEVVKTLLPSRAKTRTLHRCKNLNNIINLDNVSHFVTLPRKSENSLDFHIANRLRRYVNEISNQKVKKDMMRSHSFNDYLLNDSFEQPDLNIYKSTSVKEKHTDESENEYCDPRVLAIPMSKKRLYRKHFGDSDKNYSTRIKLDQSQKKMKEKFREFWNFIQAPFLLWNHDMKHIEGHYGTGIVSFFLFLRWMIYLNLLMTILAIGVIIVPEILFTIKEMYVQNKTDPVLFYMENYMKYNNKESSFEISTFTLPNTSTNVFDTVFECSYNYTETILGYNSTLLDAFQHVLQGTGFMELTPMFIGWYKPGIMRKFKSRYELSEGYIFVTIASFLLCLIMMVSYTKKSVRENVLKKENQLQKYCNMIFSSWDFSIEDKKLAEMKHNYIYLKFKVHLAENRRLKEISNWSTLKKITVTILRIIVNIIVVVLLGGASFLIYVDIMVSLEDETEDPQPEGFYSFFAEYRTSLIITAINIILPIIFNFLSSLENYSESFRIKISLIRCVFTRLASIGVLIVSLHSQISCSSRTECGEGIDKCQTPKCWETYVGQQIYKLSIFDFIVVLVTTFFVGFPRKLLVTKVKCKLFQLIGREEFDIPQNVLGLVYSQTLCWLGVFYCPFLPLLSVIKYFIYYYVKKFSLVINCGQSKESYRASRSNIFFIIVLMMSYLIGLFPLLYSITELETSKGCSPFRYHKSAWNTMVHFVAKLPNWVNVAVGIIGSAGFGVPVFVILSLLLYYYLTLSATYSQLSEIMKDHLQMESRDKNFLLRKFMFILHHPQK